MSSGSPELALVAAQALGIATGGMVAFGSLLVVLVLLNSERGLAAAFAYVAGYSGCYTLIGMAGLWIGERSGPVAADTGLPVAAVLHTALGTMLGVLAVRRWRNPAASGPPRIFAKFDTLSVTKAFGFGVMVAVINVKNLAIYVSAVAVVARAGLPLQLSAILIVLVVVVFCGLVFVPLAIYVLMPSRSSELLARLRVGIDNHSPAIISVVLPVFAVAFLGRGLWGLRPLFTALMD